MTFTKSHRFQTLSSLLAGSALLGLAAASTKQDIKWSECDAKYTEVAPVPIDCGNLTVPLDYSDPDSEETIELQMLRVPALKQPAKGSIIFHYGGPGPSGRADMSGFSELFQVLTGQEYDLISWDQRGTVDTIPFSCYNTTMERALATSRIGNYAVSHEDRANIGRSWALAGQQAEECYQFAKNQTGDLVGTAYTVRDVIKMAEATNEDGLLRFWGISYGTAIGATAAAMFPEKVERMLLDAVQNPHEFWHGNDLEHLTDTDKTFSAFLRTCYERPEKCAIALSNPNATAADMERKVYDLIETYRYRPVALEDQSLGGLILDQNFMKGLIRPRLYAPTSYPILAALLDLLLQGDLENFVPAYAEALGSVSEVFTGGLGNEAPFAIHCADKAYRADDLEDIIPTISQAVSASRLTGDMLSWNLHVCSQWKLASKERYEGGFHDPIDTKTPLLIMGNEYDVVTPFVSAQNVSASFPGSGLIKLNAHGHGIPQQPSRCVSRAIQAYWGNATVPEELTVCEPEAHPWDAQSWLALYPELGYKRAE